jgi:hypothetical protein
VVVGGLVPSLLIDQQHLPQNVTAYVGTMDLDLGLAFAIRKWPSACEMPGSLPTGMTGGNSHGSAGASVTRP